MIKLNEIYSKFESILPANIKKEIEDKNANGITEPKYWQVEDYFVEYMKKRDFIDIHIVNGNPIFLQIFKITEEWSLISRFMKVAIEGTSEKENDFFKFSLENKSKDLVLYLLIEIGKTVERPISILYSAKSPENPLDLNNLYYHKLNDYFDMRKVCLDNDENRKELEEIFALKYDIDLNKDKVFKSIDFILCKVNEILSK